MGIKNAAVQALVDSGADAMDNLYDVKLRFPWDDATTLITVRAEGFEPPVSKNETYQKEYHAQKIDLPSSKATLDRTFDITFSMDATYNLWGQFKTWKNSVDDEVSGGKANWPGLVGEVSVTGLTGAYLATNEPDAMAAVQNDSTKGIHFDYSNVYVSEVENPKWKTSGGAGMTYKVTFHYFGDDFAPFANGAGLSS